MYFLLFIISQNHRMVGVGRDLCGSSSISGSLHAPETRLTAL